MAEKYRCFVWSTEECSKSQRELARCQIYRGAHSVCGWKMNMVLVAYPASFLHSEKQTAVFRRPQVKQEDLAGFQGE